MTYRGPEFCIEEIDGPTEVPDEAKGPTFCMEEVEDPIEVQNELEGAEPLREAVRGGTRRKRRDPLWQGIKIQPRGLN